MSRRRGKARSRQRRPRALPPDVARPPGSTPEVRRDFDPHLRGGIGLNRLFMLDYLGLDLAGGLMGLLIGRGEGISGNAQRVVQRMAVPLATLSDIH